MPCTHKHNPTEMKGLGVLVDEWCAFLYALQAGIVEGFSHLQPPYLY